MNSLSWMILAALFGLGFSFPGNAQNEGLYLPNDDVGSPPQPVLPDTTGWAEDSLDYRPHWLNLDALFAQMQYPTFARDNGITGRVIARVLVDSTGAYVMHRIVRSPHPFLTAATLPLLPQLRSEPPRRNAQPVRA